MTTKQFATAVTLPVVFLFVSLGSAVSGSAQTQENKAVAAKKAKTKAPTVQEQIQALRQEMENQAAQFKQQIDSLKSGMEEKDVQLKQAQRTAAEAQELAAKTAASINGQQQAASANETAVSTLQEAVSGLKKSQSSLSATLNDETTRIKKAMDSPSVLRFKGISILPYGFVNGESAYRTHATGGEMPTAFGSIPYEHSDNYALSEMYLSARQTRFGMNIEGKVSWGTLRAYAEGDFFGAGTTSNENQTNSYVFRQRVLMVEAETHNHWTFSAGQGWSLVAETRKGISTAAANIITPQMIDPNYVAGYVWNRDSNFRLTKSFPKAAFAVSLENPQLLYTASLAGSTPYAVLGSQGLSAGLLNAAVSTCSPSTSIVNYTNQVDGATDIAVPVYKTVNACTNLANITFNQAPDVLAKVAFDPGLGHYELFGVLRFGHETVYPGETTNGNLYGGLKDIASGAVIAPALSSANAVSDSITLGGIGGSVRLPVVPNKLSVGAKALYGAGVGRYGDTNLPDVTADAWGGLSPIHNLSALATVEVNPTPRMQIYLYYGGDYASRVDFGSASTTSLGAPTAEFCLTGTTTCTTTPTAAQMASGGSWGGHWATPAAAAVGYGSRLLSNSACLTNTNPGYSGSSTGYYPGGSCGAQTRDTQEGTIGYWYDIYKGDGGRLRQGLQYSYAVREAWSGASGIGAKGVENMFFTSLRYYLP